MAVIAGLASAVIGASSARKAAKAQTRAAEQDIAFQRETRDMIFNRYEPFYGAGKNALGAYNYELGLGAKPAGYGGFEKSADYNFRFGEGVNATNALAGARGGLNSGRTMQDLTKFGQGFASQERGNYLNRLAGLTDGGMAAAGGQAGAATNAAAGTSNALAAIGNAQAAGAIGTGNALMGGISNGLGLWNYQKQTTPGFGSKNWLFSGNAWG